MQGGRVLKEGLALEQRAKQGTTVTVRDLFFNTPVRRKQLIGAGYALLALPCHRVLLTTFFGRPEIGHAVMRLIVHCRIKKEVDDCREHILRLALPRSTTVGFTVVDSMRQYVLLSLKRVSSNVISSKHAWHQL